MQLKGKTALIAGAARNSGKAIALAFAAEGADLILLDKLSEGELDEVAGQCAALGVQAVPFVVDVGAHEAVNQAVRLGLERLGKVDVLVSVAAVRPHKPFWEFSHEEWQQGFAVNLHSTFYLVKALVPHMIERRSGNIIALGGTTSLTADAGGFSLLVASKHGLYGLIKSLALDLGPYGIRANLIALSLIQSEHANPEWYPVSGSGPQKSAWNSAEVERLPLKRRGTPQEVAKVALFLASDASSYVTGDRIVCAGGRYM